MRRPEEIKREIVRQWLAKADEDIGVAEVLLTADMLFAYPICLHAQQAGEKYLRAYLTWREVDSPKTHVIEELLDLITPMDPDLSSSVGEAVALTPYGVEVRYPGEAPEPNLDETKRAIALARQVRDTVLTRLGEISDDSG